MSRCIDTPVSLWALERYLIDDVSPEERAEVEDHLAACPLCRTRLDAIDSDPRPLPKLSVAVPAETQRRAWLGLGQWRLAAVAFGAAAVFACFLMLPMLQKDDASPQHIGGVAARGGCEPVLTVVRERDGAIENNPSRYASGDRFRLELTLSGTKARRVEVVVFQEDEVYFPSEETALVTPGNHHVLPGVFRMTGDTPFTICVVLGPDLPERSELVLDGQAALPDGALCRTLESQDSAVQ